MNSKDKKTYRLCLILGLLLCLVVRINAEEFDSAEISRQKEITRSFPISSGSKLNVDNRYGNITITHWNKKEVYIRVVIESKARNQERAAAAVERVSIDMDQKGNNIYATTSLSKNSSNNNNEKLTINYYIQAPTDLDLSLEQRYGDIYLPDITNGRCELTVRYGNLRAGDFTNNLNITARYSNLILGNIKNASIDISYCGEVKIKSGEKVDIDSRYSNIQADYFKQLNLEKRYGNLKIKEGDKLSIGLRYSDCTIDKLNMELKISDMAYSNTTVKEVSSSFQSIYTHAKYGNLTLFVPANMKFEVEASSMKYSSLNLKDFSNLSHINVDAPSYFKYGVNGGGNAKIKFEGNNYSNLTIKKY